MAMVEEAGEVADSFKSATALKSLSDSSEATTEAPSVGGSDSGSEGFSSTSRGGSCEGEEEGMASRPDSESSEEDAEEEELRRDVPQILDSMNEASNEVNMLERQVHAAQARYHSSVADCDIFYNELRRKNGRDFDRVKAYLSAAQQVKAASHRLQSIAHDFSLAGTAVARAQGDQSSSDEVETLKGRQNGLEADYVRALREHQAAQQALENVRTQIGDVAIQDSLPAFQELQQRQLKLVVEHSRMQTLLERANHSKQKYRSCMKELERISSAVHDSRRQRAEASH